MPKAMQPRLRRGGAPLLSAPEKHRRSKARGVGRQAPQPSDAVIFRLDHQERFVPIRAAYSGPGEVAPRGVRLERRNKTLRL